MNLISLGLVRRNKRIPFSITYIFSYTLGMMMHSNNSWILLNSFLPRSYTARFAGSCRSHRTRTVGVRSTSSSSFRYSSALAKAQAEDHSYSQWPNNAHSNQLLQSTSILNAPSDLLTGRPKRNIERLPPMLREIKLFQDTYKDYILFVQVGSFYEIYDFGGYLDEVAQLLNLRIAKSDNAERRFAGFPMSSRRDYIQILLRHGKSIAIFEQDVTGSDASRGYKPNSAVMTRKLSRIITPGINLEDGILDGDSQSFLLSIFIQNSDIHDVKNRQKHDTIPIGLAWGDVSTGDFFVHQTTLAQLPFELSRIQPTEVLISSIVPTDHPLYVNIRQTLGPLLPITTRPPHIFGDTFSRVVLARKMIQSHTADSEALVHNSNSSGSSSSLPGDFNIHQISASQGLLAYVSEMCQDFQTPIFQSPQSLNSNSLMVIDACTIQALEITQNFREKTKRGSLLGSIDKTFTAAGKRLLEKRLRCPSICVDEINRRLDLVQFFTTDQQLLSQVRYHLRFVKDVQKSIQRINFQRGGVSDFQRVLSSLVKANSLRKLLETRLTQFPVLGGIIQQLHDYDLFLEQYENLIQEGSRMISKIDSPGVISDGVSPELDNLRRELGNLEKEEVLLAKQIASILEIKEEKIKLESKGGVYIRIGNKISATAQKRLERLKEEIYDLKSATKSSYQFSHKAWTTIVESKQTLFDEIVGLENQIFKDACGTLLKLHSQLLQTCEAIAELDVASALAVHACEWNYVRPEITEEPIHHVRGGRHPVVEEFQAIRGESFVKNDVHLTPNERLWILTGPNMGGKSTFLRQTALLSILAQAGSFVPADHARLGIVDRLFSRIGASDNLAANESTFYVEMRETATILRHATKNSLVLLDEVGRGTGTLEGISVAYATLRHLHDQNQCRGIFATHYHELASLIDENKSLNVASDKEASDTDEFPMVFENIGQYYTTVEEDADGGIKCLHKIHPGIMNKSFGIEIAAIAGLPSLAIEMAKNMWTKLKERSVIGSS